MHQQMSWTSIQTLHVHHCHNSHAIILTHPLGKYVYSGDCRPSLELIKHGQDCDMLVHEATFFSNNEMAHDSYQAERRRHSTGVEAVIVGERMGAKGTILNHFSSRYSFMPKVEGSRVAIAVDLMDLRRGDFERLDKYGEAFAKLYPERVIEEEKDSKAIEE